LTRSQKKTGLKILRRKDWKSPRRGWRRIQTKGWLWRKRGQKIRMRRKQIPQKKIRKKMKRRQVLR